MPTAEKRDQLRDFFSEALDAIEPEKLTRRALRAYGGEQATLVAIGKAAAAMSRGAAEHFDAVTGVCVTSHEAEVPDGVELHVGDHPIPGERSFEAGRRVLGVVSKAETPIIALISGGGSSLCELPRPGISADFLTQVARRLVESGASIAEMNLVRRHLSAIKGGGLLAAASQPVTTFAISDVRGAPPEVIASGPTIPQLPDVEGASGILERLGIEATPEIVDAMEIRPARRVEPGPVHVIADGHTAAMALVEAARRAGIRAEMVPGWLSGPVEEALETFFDGADSFRVAAGEPEVEVAHSGRGGRNTHAALLAATMIAGTEWVFAALGTDGVDGSSGAAGAIVDGTTLSRGGDPRKNLAESDSATYLAATGDLVSTGPTGTNVADLWVLWPGQSETSH